jgi:uncharacterized membrane protein YqjE
MNEAPSSSSSAHVGPGERLLRSTQGMLATLMALFETRVALLATELEEEKRRVLAILGWGAVGVLTGTVACVFLAGWITVLMWDTHPLLALGGLTLVFGALCAVAVRKVRELLAPTEALLAASLAELQADRDALKAAAMGLSQASAGEGTPGPTPHGREH